MARPVALLDANVLYPARLRDLLVRLAIAGLYQARWSDKILDECFENLVADRPDLPTAHLHRTRRLMAIALPDAEVRDFEHLIAGIELPDPDDRHVVAAALATSASHLVTANLRDFPTAELPASLTVASPDEFVSLLIRDDLDTVLMVIDKQAAGLTRPPMTVLELLDGLAAVGLGASAESLRMTMR